MMKKLKSIWSRVRINSKTILCLSGQWVVYVYTIVGFLAFWVSFCDVLPTCWEFWKRLCFSVGVLLFLFILCFIVATIVTLSKKRILVVESPSRHKVYVEYGDVFSADVIEKGYARRRNVVVSVNRCFDTIVDDNLVSSRSLHGRCMNDLYANDNYSTESLNEAIQSSLNTQNAYGFELNANDKPRGNRLRYSVGTVAEVLGRDNVMFFFLGLTKFDSRFQASTTKDEYFVAIQKLIEYCNARAQGYPVVMPLIGSDLARTGMSHAVILEYLLLVFKINRDIISCDFHIVIWNGNKSEIALK